MFKHTKKFFAVLAAFSLLFVYACEPGGGKQSKGKSKTLKQTQSKGFVRCGVSQGLPGFSNADASGNWTGVDVDVCRAVAAAVLGDAGKVKFIEQFIIKWIIKTIQFTLNYLLTNNN